MWEQKDRKGFKSSPKCEFPLINAVTLGSQNGIIFENARHPDSIFVIHKAAFSGFVGNVEIDASDFFHFLINSIHIPDYFHIYDPPPHLVSSITSQDSGVKFKLRKRIQLRHDKKNRSLGNAHSAFSNEEVTRITMENFHSLEVFNLNMESKFWSSGRDFLLNGFGFVSMGAINDPHAICYSACVADNLAEIDVATLPDFQRKGLAISVVEKFVGYCLENGIQANWDCFAENIGSLKTAIRAGFEERKTYSFLTIIKPKKES
jgi:RimJ/RimL family protein N-acetyltransferase